MIDINFVYNVVNVIAMCAGLTGLFVFWYLHFYLHEEYPARLTIPLLGVASVLTLIGSGLWFSGPISAVITRVLIVVAMVISEIVIIRPVQLIRQRQRDRL